jgi:hypothetical protein
MMKILENSDKTEVRRNIREYQVRIYFACNGIDASWKVIQVPDIDCIKWY